MPNLNGASDVSGLLRLPNLKVLKTYEDDGKFIIVVASVLPQIRSPCCLFTDVKKNGTKAIRFRDFAVQKQETWLEIKRQRFTCGLCGKVHYEPLPDLDAEFRVTKRFRVQLEKDAVDDTFAKTSKDNAVDVTLVKRIFYAYAKPIIDDYKPDMPTILGMDEKWLYGAPRFVLSDIGTKRILDMQRSRRKIDLHTYFDGLPNRNRVEVVCQDMWRPYKQLTKPYFPNAVTVIDKFHVQKLSDIAVHYMRKKIARDLDAEERKSLKGRIGLLQCRWPPKEDPKLPPGKTPKRDELERVFATYPKLREVYFLREAFYDIYLAESRQEALERLKDWKRSIPPEFEIPFRPAKRAFENWQPFILNHFEHRYTSAYVERMNGLAARMNTNAAGMDYDYLRAKLLLKYGRFKDERKELQYSHERRESDAQFHRIERKMLEALYFDRPRFSGRVLGYGIDLSTLEAAIQTDWL